MDDRTLKENIRRVREDLGLTQEEFAQELGIDASTYWRLEEGGTRIISPYVYKIANYAGISAESLLNGKDMTGMLEDADDLKEKISAQRKFYEEQLEAKDLTIRNLNNYINSLQK